MPSNHSIKAALEQTGRPLLLLLHHLTGLESTFVTTVDWDAGTQDVVLSLNVGEELVPEGTQVDWKDSMCRLTFERGEELSTEVQEHFPGSIGAEKLGMQTFFALPIFLESSTVGTVCGASRLRKVVPREALEAAKLVGEALALHVRAFNEGVKQRKRAEAAETMVRKLFGDLERAQEEAKHLEQLAHTDALTRLHNRRGFMEDWDKALGERHGASSVGLILVDVDRFKAVNDRHGHAVGDRVLQAAAAALKYVTRPTDTAARIGGDEFAVIVRACPPLAVAQMGRRIQAAFAEICASFGVDCTLSVGASASETASGNELFEEADNALYRSKSRRDRARLTSASPTMSGSGPLSRPDVSDAH